MATPEELWNLLRQALKFGACAPELLNYAMALVDAIYAGALLADASPAQRAAYAEAEIRESIKDIERVDVRIACFLIELLGLRGDRRRRDLCERRKRAGAVFVLSGATAGKPHYEGQSLMHLAMALDRRQAQRRPHLPQPADQPREASA